MLKGNLAHFKFVTATASVYVYHLISCRFDHRPRGTISFANVPLSAPKFERSGLPKSRAQRTPAPPSPPYASPPPLSSYISFSFSAMDADEDALGLGSSSAPSAPGRVSLPPFSPNLPFPSPRRLSSRFSQPSRPAPPARRNPAWVSLQGRLVGAEEATSARFAAPGLSRHEAAAWELFSPLHRVLIVAVVATATWRSERSRKVAQLQRSIDLRVRNQRPNPCCSRCG